MTDAEATLYAASLTAIVALTAALIAAVVAFVNESKRRRETRRADELRELHRWTADVFVHLFAIQHETEWLTWHARYRAQAVDEQAIADYENAIHSAYPKLLGAMAVVASVDYPLFQHLKQVADDIYGFEGEVGRASVGVPRAAAVQELALLFDRAGDYYQHLPEELVKAMANATVAASSPGLLARAWGWLRSRLR